MQRLGVAVLCAALGCSTRSAPPPRSRVHIPLPAGWSATTPPEGGFRAGPAGRTVLRVEPRAMGGTLPTPADLAAAFDQGSQSIRSSLANEIIEKDLSIAIIEISKQGLRGRALVGAKRVGREWLLCASEPGSSEEEVAAAAEVCRGLSEGGDT